MLGMISNLIDWIGAKEIKWKWIILLVLVDLVLSYIIVVKVPYTEIDWVAYMEEVEGFLGGERDYTKIHGSTGPLVYPAGFLYIFTGLRALTQNGIDIRTAQYLFMGMYILTLLVVLSIYKQSRSVSAVVCVVLLLSKRVHSIYMLRMFNDCIAMLLGYIAVYLFSLRRWALGSAFYSLAVSIKMNLLLFAPGLLALYIFFLGYPGTLMNLSICAGLQVFLGLPFLTTYPVQYLTKAFELGRVFQYKWTVNFKFLPEDYFVSKTLSVVLLAATITAYGMFAVKWMKEVRYCDISDLGLGKSTWWGLFRVYFSLVSTRLQ